MGGGTKTTSTNSTEQASTVPQTPTYARDPVVNYFSGISNYQQSDPYAFVTPTNSLQNGAYQGASGLFGASPLYGQAASAAQGVLGAAPQTYTANQTFAGVAPLGQAQQATAQGYQPGALGQAAQVQSPTLGNAAQATAANAGTAQNVNLGGYNTATLGNAAQAGNVNLDPNATQAQAQSLLTNLQAYQNPYTQQVVDTTLADFDANAGKVRAQQQRDAALAGAFGGSRFGIAQANTEGELGRARASADANLRSSAFNTAAGLSGQDADRRQQAGLFNAGAQNQRTEFGAGLNAANSQFNAGQKNQYGLARFDAQNAANQFGANALNTGALANQSAANQFGLANAGFQQDTNLFNTGQQNQFALQGADLAQQASLANMGAQNQFSLAGFDANNQANQFGANAQNTANLANMQAANTYGLAGFDAANQMNQFNAGVANQGSQFNTGIMNEAQQQQLARQLQAAGLLSDIGSAYGSNYRADLGLQADLGNQLYQTQSAYTNAPLTQLQNVGNLLNPGFIQAVSGQTVTGQNSGVAQERTSGGLFQSLLGTAAQIGGAALMGSDRRLKRDMQRLGEDPDGLGAWRFNYVWDEPDAAPRYGVMADEVAAIRPWALGPELAGFATVDYGAL